MTALKLSDLFTKYGHNFDGVIRVDDQKKLITRLREHEIFNDDVVKIEEFLKGTDIIPIFQVNHWLHAIIKKCSLNRIDVD